MTIETERLILRRFTVDDAQAYLPLVADREINRYTGQVLVQTVEEARQILCDFPLRDYETVGYGRMACIEKTSGRLIGFSGMKYLPDLGDADVGYRFVPEAWGKGYATESAEALMRECVREFKLRRVIGMVDPRNEGSSRVLKKLGLAFERKIDVGADCLFDLYAVSFGEALG